MKILSVFLTVAEETPDPEITTVPDELVEPPVELDLFEPVDPLVILVPALDGT